MMKLSKLYVDEAGFLMCGEPDMSTSMVEGLRFLPFNINDGKNFDYEIKFVNDLGWLCNGYDKKFCKTQYRILNESNE